VLINTVGKLFYVEVGVGKRYYKKVTVGQDWGLDWNGRDSA
jgi:hypothetical protein